MDPTDDAWTESQTPQLALTLEAVQALTQQRDWTLRCLILSYWEHTVDTSWGVPTWRDFSAIPAVAAALEDLGNPKAEQLLTWPKP